MKTQSKRWLVLKNLLRGQLPRTLTRGPDGQLLIKCPSCSQRIPIFPGTVGQPAFDCPHCGKKDTWATDASHLGQQKAPQAPITPSRWQMPIVTVAVLAWLAASVYLQLSTPVAMTIFLGGMVAAGVVLALRRRRGSAPGGPDRAAHPEPPKES